MRTFNFALGTAALLLAAAWTTQAREAVDLPEGPIRERHALMEGIGANARMIGEAMKAGDTDQIASPARQIAEAARQLGVLFPAGSQHSKSRAKSEIWDRPDIFNAEIQTLEAAATALAQAADEQTDVPAAANELFAACKSCHTKFRVPED